MGGRRVRVRVCVRARRVRNEVRGEYGFSSLVKQNKEGKNCAVFCFAGFCFLKIFCDEVIAKQKKKLRAIHYYSPDPS